jgi:hypothetical protein
MQFRQEVNRGRFFDRCTSPRKSFCWCVQQLSGNGGFALATGAAGYGKAVALRFLSASMAAKRDATVGVIRRPRPTSPTPASRWDNSLTFLRKHNVISASDPATGRAQAQTHPRKSILRNARKNRRNSAVCR